MGKQGNVAAGARKTKSCLRCCPWKHFKREFHIPLIKEETEKNKKSYRGENVPQSPHEEKQALLAEQE